MDLAHLTGIAPNAIDLSYGDLTLAPAAQIPELVVQNLWTGSVQPRYRVSNLQHAQNLGRRVAGYFALSSSRSGAAHYAMARNAVPDYIWNALEFLVVDVELEGLWEKQIADALDLAETVGLRIIYSGRWFWPRQPYAGADFGALLWDARYATAGVVPPWIGYGQWDREEELVGVQVQGGHLIGGCLVDSNIFDLGRLGMDQQTRDAFTAILKTIGADGAKIDAVAGAFLEHVEHHPGGVDPALQQTIDALKADHAKWQAAAAAAAKALGVAP